ncbi:MAG: hypothetical protein ACI9TF_001812 [Paracrocinitomix sp.]
MADALDYPIDPPHEVRFAVMHMRWLNLTFLHWQFDPEQVQAILPDNLTVDTFDGVAWVGLVPFEMEVQLPGGVPIPREGQFPETNVRTYVRGPDGTPGVWFCSLEAGRLSATAVARATYGLPYYWAEMTAENDGSAWAYRSKRKWPGPKGVHSDVDVIAGKAIVEHSSLERFLTARWGLYSTFLGHTLYAPITHETWSLHEAELTYLDDGLMDAAGFAVPHADPLVHWTPGVGVRVGRPRRVRS